MDDGGREGVLRHRRKEGEVRGNTIQPKWAWRWCSPKEAAVLLCNSVEVAAYRRPCSDNRQGERRGRVTRGLVGVEKGGMGGAA
jgi:hypothetical protein